MAAKHLADLITDYRAGRLARDDYWSALRQIHLGLLGYAELLAQGDLDHIAIFRGELRIILKNGIVMVWDPNEIRTAPTMLVNHGRYEIDVHPAIRRVVQDSRVVVDVGANIGWYSLHIARWQPEARILAFEPIPTTFAQLERNITLNNLEGRVQAFQTGLGEVQDQVTFYVPSFMGSVAASRQPLFETDENAVITATIEPFDTWLGAQSVDHVDFVKCDIEGAELLFLRGAKEALTAHRPIVMLEMLRKWSQRYGYHPNDIITFMAGLGYVCTFYEGGRFQPLDHIDDDCQHTNFFFLQPKHYDKLRAQSTTG